MDPFSLLPAPGILSAGLEPGTRQSVRYSMVLPDIREDALGRLGTGFGRSAPLPICFKAEPIA